MQAFENLKNQYLGVGSVFARYWRAYGGHNALLYSPYAHAALLLTGLLFPYWLESPWWDTALTVVPSILGFTLAGFTIWLGFGDQRFQQLISTKRPGKTVSAYIAISAAFVHFIVIQFLAVSAAVIGKATAFALPTTHPAQPLIHMLAPIGYFIGFLLFIYSLMTALAATMGVFRTASMFESLRSKELAEKKNTPTDDEPVR